MAPALYVFRRLKPNASTFAASNPTGLKAPHGVVALSTPAATPSEMPSASSSMHYF